MQHDGQSTITISLKVDNTYELYAAVTTHVIDRVVPAPPVDEDSLDAWAYEHIYSCTGVGHEDGDSWYYVIVTACSDPTLVGRTFTWGY